MSKKIKKVLIVLMAIMLAIPVLQVTEVEAASKVKLAKKMTVTYYAKEKIRYNTEVHILGEFKASDKVKISKLKSSNPKVLKVSTLRTDYDQRLILDARKAGTSTVSFKATVNGKSRNYECVVKVVKYQNPFKTFKVGSKNYTSKYKNSENEGGTYTSKKVQGRLNIVPQKGWKISRISLVNMFTNKSKKIRKNSSINLDSKGFNRLWVTMKHSKTGVTRHFYITR